MDRANYIEAILDVTGGENWTVLTESLEREIRNLQVRALQAPDWDTVVDLRGQAKSLVLIINMRENAEQEVRLDENSDASI